MNDEDTLDEPEEIIKQARESVAQQNTQKHQPELPDDETIPAHAIPSFPSLRDDDATIDVAPEFIRELRQDQTQKPNENIDPTIPQQLSHPPQPPEPNNRKRRKTVVALLLLSLFSALPLIAWTISRPRATPPPSVTRTEESEAFTTPTTIAEIPSAPNLSVTTETGKIIATWLAVEAGDVITRWEIDNGTQEIIPLSPTDKTYTWFGVEPNHYTINLRACNNSGCSRWSRQSIVVAPNTPATSSTTSTTSQSTDTTQTIDPPPQDTEAIQEEATTIDTAPVTTIDTTPATTIDTTPEPTVNTTPEPTVSSKPRISPPAAPTLAGQHGRRSITVSWSPNDGGSPASRWEIDDNNLGGISFTYQTSYTWNDVSAGEYTIKVRGCNAAGCGPWAEIVASPFSITLRQIKNDVASEGRCPESCTWLEVGVSGYPPGTYEVKCWSYNYAEGIAQSYATARIKVDDNGAGTNPRACLNGDYSDVAEFSSRVYVTVDGHPSNTISLERP